MHNVGEIDIAAVNDDKLLIVEVKTRHKRNVGKNYPIENSVGYKKRFKVKKTADYLIEKYKLYNLNIYFLSAFVTYNSGGLIQNVEFESFLWNFVDVFLHINYNNTGFYKDFCIKNEFLKFLTLKNDGGTDEKL